MDPYAALLDDDEADNTAALAAALGGQRNAGLLGLLTGDKVLGGVGQALLQGAERGTGRLEARQAAAKEGSLRKALAAEAAKRQAARDAQMREQALADKADERGYQTGRDARQNAAALQRTKLMADAQRGREDRAKTQRDEERFDNDLKDYSKAIPEGAATFFEQARTVDSILQEPESDSDIPGVGPVDSRLPKAFSSDKDLDMQKNVGQMMLAYQKLVTGTGGGAEELKKIADAGADLSNEKSFRRGFESLKKNYAAYLRKVQGGYKPEVVEAYEKRVPGMRVPVTPGMSLEDPIAAPPAMSQKAAAALQWAKANPSDPRSAAILKKLGVAK